MTLNLGGSYFSENDFGHSQQNASNIMGMDNKAVLYIFKPYQNQFGDVGLRPFQYHFDENFINDTQEISDVAKRGAASSSSIINDLMATTNLNEYMIPSFQPSMMFKSSHLSDRYRFILILTEKARGLIGGNTLVSSNSGSQIRRIYSGYFEGDEPFNPVTLSSTKRTLNPNAFMVITHKTIVGTSTSMERFGAKTSINTRATEEIINPQIAQNLIAHNGQGYSDHLFLMTPANCINSMSQSEEGYNFAAPGANSDITSDKGNSVVSDVLAQPSQNVSQIVKGMIQFQDDVSHRGRLMHNRGQINFEDTMLDESLARMKLGRYMDLPRSSPTSSFDLDVDSRISPVDINTLVSGDLDVIDFDLERPLFYETADQMESSIVNQYSSLITSVVVPILNAAGLNAMQFEYQIARLGGRVQDDFRTHSAEPNWPVPNQDLIGMTKAVEMELVNGIFATIFHSKGDFHVAVSANATGMTIVRLSLVGQGYKNHVDFEIPSCLGGFITPLVGDSATNMHNSESIETLYNVATGTHSGGYPKNFNADDRSFMDHANNLPWPQIQTIDPNHPRMNLDELERD